MLFRSLIILGFCAAMALNSSAVAGAPPANTPLVPQTAATADVVTIAAPQADAKSLKKKKVGAKAKGKTKAEPLTKEELAAKAKADEKAKREAAAKAKADEKAKLAAKVKAEKEKRLALAKAEKDKQLAAKKKADDAKKLAKAKADEERKVAKAQAAEERRVAKAQAAEERRLAAAGKAKAAEDFKLAKLRAAEEKRLAITQAAEDARQTDLARLVSMEVVQTGNNSELRSERQEAPKPTGLFAGLFGGAVTKQSMLPETRALDAALELKEAKKKFNVKPEFEPQVVQFSGYERGTIVVDTASHFLYLVESSSRARRYAIAVGRDGLQYKGVVKVGDKQEWPRWIPTLDMQKREPKKYGQYKDGMPGGGQNPLGARAIYLYQGGKDTHLRIHGTIAPETIGTDSSNGCFRMINDHVMDLYRRVPVGTEVVVM